MSYQHREYRPDGSWWVSRFEDDQARTVTTYDETGAVITGRPYTAAEDAAADAAVVAEAEHAAYEARQAVDRAILDATAALMADAHTDGEAWVQPVGAHNAVPLDVTVTDGGKTWRSKHPANVWPPSPSSPWWEEVTDNPGPQPWALGAYYFMDTRVTFGGQTWRCLHEHLAQAGWEPGAPGMYAVWSVD